MSSFTVTSVLSVRGSKLVKAFPLSEGILALPANIGYAFSFSYLLTMRVSWFFFESQK